jgi:polysaccharide biosynthesis/export protein
VPALPPQLAGLAPVAPAVLADAPAMLGSGDRLLLAVAGDKALLTGTYVIAPNGRLAIEGVGELMAAGRTRQAVAEDLRRQLIERGLIRDLPGNVQLALSEAAGVQVSVAGAVFEPGLVMAGERSADARATTVNNPASGDFNAGRTLSAALRAAGGIRPDAATSAVYLSAAATMP